MSNNRPSTRPNNRAAELMAEQARKERLRRLLSIGGVALVVLLIVVAAVVASVVKKNHDDQQIEKNVAAAGHDKYGVVIGPDDAQHHVVVYEDFLCPYCGKLEKDSHEQLAELAAKGEVQVDYRPFNLLGGDDASSYSVRATSVFAVVLQQDGQVAAKKLHDLLYAHQPSESGPFPSDDELVTYAAQAGADEAKVRAAVAKHAGLDWVDAATKAAFATGLSGTPTVLVDGKMLSNGTAEGLLDAVS